ncbi:acyl-CoA synthetase (AMP-forming)/AMP-acid ligase II [Nocardia sp. GAS34]|uniref:class I adenylate-forming enzyme family protein n=1 Tax=unclassified Nocardia TaxID=2637762 RepID=UPI003D2433AB
MTADRGKQMTQSKDRVTETSVAALIADHADQRSTSTFLEDARSDRGVSYGALAMLSARWTAYLDARTPPDAAVVLDIADPLTFAIIYLSVIAAGRCAVPVDPHAPMAERRRTLEPISPSAVIGDRPDLARALGILALPTSPEPHTTPGTPHAAHRAPGGSVLLATSGSTGAPKAMRLTEDQLLHVATAIADHNKLGVQDRGYNCLPLFHINAEVVALLATLRAGACLVLDQRFHATGFWPLLTAKRITWLNAVPAILGVLTAGGAAAPTVPPELRFIRSASAPLPVPVRERISAATGVPIVESYGMTEAASQITATGLAEPAPAGSCGRPVGIELQVRDAQNRVVRSDTVGRVHIRGAGVITGYMGGRAAERFDVQGWLDTGDMGRIDEAGFVYLAGRSDDVINRGGELLYPREIEEVLQAEPGVRDVVVVGRVDPILGSVPVAHVIPARWDDHTELLDQLRTRCEMELSRIKQPAEIVLVEDFPRAPTGKVQRHRMRSRLQVAVV